MSEIYAKLPAHVAARCRDDGPFLKMDLCRGADRRHIDARSKVMRQLITAGNLLLTAALESRDSIGLAAEAWSFAVERLRALDEQDIRSIK